MCLSNATLGEVSDRANGTIRTGPFGSQLHESDYSDDGTPVVMPKNIVDGRVSVEGIARISNEHVARLAQHKLRAGDIVYGRRGDIGRRALITEREDGWLCGTGCLRISLGNSVLDPAFLYYYLGQPSVIGWIQGQAIGATMPNLNTAILRSVPVTYPDFAAQQKIAGILSAYDELIENNTRRIAIVEEMARSLYREWFVDFRFPGHELVGMVHSEMGYVPERWEVCRLSTLVETQYGYTESARENEVGPKFLRGMDINKAPFIQWDAVPYCPISPEEHEKFKLAVGDVLVIRMADPGKVGIVEQQLDAVFASYLIRLRIVTPKLLPYFLFYFLTSARYQDYVTGASTGTTRKSASAGVITDIDLVIPPQQLLKQFEKQVSILRKLLNNLLLQNAILRSTRDLLLPRLLSGNLHSAYVEEAGRSISEEDSEQTGYVIQGNVASVTSRS
jgi:type I restriction enzyme, S subunit